MEKKSSIINSVIVFIGLVFLGFSIIFAANTLKPKELKESRYQIVQLNEVNIAVIDQKTDKIYYKFIAPSEGPTNWEEMILPN
jgi:hypothetical protein